MAAPAQKRSEQKWPLAIKPYNVLPKKALWQAKESDRVPRHVVARNMTDVHPVARKPKFTILRFLRMRCLPALAFTCKQAVLFASAPSWVNGRCGSTWLLWEMMGMQAARQVVTNPKSKSLTTLQRTPDGGNGRSVKWVHSKGTSATRSGWAHCGDARDTGCMQELVMCDKRTSHSSYSPSLDKINLVHWDKHQSEYQAVPFDS